MRKTKVICTIGPACENEEILTKMCRAGMDVARLNFSHGTHEEHQRKIDLIKATREKLAMPIAIMLDTKGPEYRIKTFEKGSISLQDGDEFTFTTEDVIGNEKIVSVNYKQLMENLEVGDTILVNNGLVNLRVIGLDETRARCTVVTGGILSDRKSMNFPEKVMKQDFLSDQDREDLLFGIRNEVDFVAASFVSSKQDIADMRAFLDEHGGGDVELIAKIENRAGVENIEEICEIADGIMIARGDLGCEVANEQLPIIQKTIIKACREMGKIAIVATEMLESMMSSIRPKRAETSDIANAVIDGVDAVMLSGETTIGKYPVEAVRTMADICETTEEYVTFDYIDDNAKVGAISNAISENLVESANRLDAKLICVTTLTGRTAKQISNLKPQALILALCPDEDTCHSLALNWGVYTDILPKCKNTDEVLKNSLDKCKKFMKLKKRDVILISGNSPYYGADKSTNFIKIQEM